MEATGIHEQVAGFIGRKLNVAIDQQNAPYLISHRCLVKLLGTKTAFRPDVIVLVKNNTEFLMSAPLAKASLSQTANRRKTFLRWLAVLTLIYLLLVGIGLISRGFRAVVGGEAEQLFAFAENPFLGLVVGILSIALVQSSSLRLGACS